MMRLFVGIALPDSVRDVLGAICHGVPGARWVASENLHLTLRFIGEVDGGVAEDIDAALNMIRVESFRLELGGIDLFGNARKPRILYLNAAPCEPVMRLAAKVETAMTAAGLAPETRKFKPHVTLARLRDPSRDRVAAFIEHNNTLRFDPVPVTAFTLFRSHLGKDRAHYEALVDYPLGAGNGLPEAAA